MNNWNELIDRIDTNNYLLDLDNGIYDSLDAIELNDNRDVIDIDIYNELEEWSECSL